jgi:hypothetical protein
MAVDAGEQRAVSDITCYKSVGFLLASKSVSEIQYLKRA